MNTDISFPYSKNVPLRGGIDVPVSAREEVSAPLPMAIDPVLTRVAVELTIAKNHATSSTIQPCLNALQKLISLDCVFVALFGSNKSRIEWVAASKYRYEHCNPYELVGSRQPCNAELSQRLLRGQSLDIRDCTNMRGEYGEFCSHMLPLNLCSMLVGGIAIDDQLTGLIAFGTLHHRQRWDMEIHLIMKLITASYAAGYERYQMSIAG